MNGPWYTYLAAAALVVFFGALFVNAIDLSWIYTCDRGSCECSQVKAGVSLIFKLDSIFEKCLASLGTAADLGS